MRRRDLPALVIPALAGCRAPVKAHDPLRPASASDGWTVGTASAFDEKALRKLAVELQQGAFSNTHAVLIEQDGQLVYEQYLAGPDERVGDSIGYQTPDASSVHDLRSVTKSVTAGVLGIALGADFERALFQPILSFFPQVKARPELEACTLHDVLIMSAGLEWNEMTVPYTTNANDELQMYAVKDPIAMVLARPVREKPGSTWYYNGGLTQLLAGVVQQITGKRLDLYAEEVLFKPLGFHHHEWLLGPGWSPAMPMAASGLRLRARDLAKFGSVYLHEGQWGGKPIVPAGWVQRSMKRHVATIGEWSRGGTWGYGYQMWVGRFPEGFEVAAGVGNGNQRVFVMPKERLAVTVFAGDYNRFEGHSERILLRVMAAHRQT
jgi:CubicO group peptidase (beta-lactamase class C family)